ncbi:hypothetical protein PG994_003826 [Apiospora phragmitis]|uniref:Pre-rRNA-processing protein RIX1 n=1 Tax=Apiospora phragmitis TaxID=2905665 RepID=A0ABR1VZ81_9PEZI
MSLVSLPPELRSLCRKLTTTKPDQLPSLLPLLLKDIQRCQGPLSAPQEAKTGSNSTEAAVLVHKLRTQITTLLNGRTVEGRFVAVALVKAFIETGGWECLRASDAWVKGLLSVLQKRDPVVTKELCVVTLTKIYVMLQSYQTLIREIATPTLPAFAQACLGILKPPSSSKAPKPSFNFIQTLFDAFSTLIPLYPTTLRPFNGQLRSVTRQYLAPTSSDDTFTPSGLRASSRRLVIRLHMTAAKGGGADEWTKHLNSLIKEFHVMADHVLRAVHENWESTTGYTHQSVSFDTEPAGGSESPDQFPRWQGIQSGSERMISLLEYIGDCLCCSTKVAVTLPISALFDILTRIASICPPAPGREKTASTQTNNAIGREEKDDLWAVFPDIQVAVMKLCRLLANRLERNYVPLAQETLDCLLRMVETGYRLPQLRETTFELVSMMLPLCGPTMSKTNVTALALVAKTCCRDLLGHAGHIKAPKTPTPTVQNGNKTKNITQNADLFLTNISEEQTLQSTLAPSHLKAAETLLAAFFSYLPQHYINLALRYQLLKAAILCRVKDAQIASVLHPSRDRSGRIPQVILPFLYRQFPHDESIEVLRFNFRPMTGSVRADFADGSDYLEDEDAAMTEPADGYAFDKPFEAAAAVSQAAQDDDENQMAVDEPTSSSKVAPPPPTVLPIQPSPFLAQPTTPKPEPAAAPAESPSAHTMTTRSLKRKSSSGVEAAAATKKRVELENKTAVVVEETTAAVVKEDNDDPGFTSVGSLVESTLKKTVPVEEAAADDDSDDESVHLNMELDSDGDDDE